MGRDETAVALCEVAAGTLSGMIGKFVEYPFDTIKVRMQTSGAHSSALACGASLLKREGVRGMFSGISSPLAGAAAEYACLFFVYGRVRHWILADAPVERDLTMPEVMVAGMATGVVVSHVLTPVELLKCKMQVQGAGGAPQYRSPWHAARVILREQGGRGLFRGHVATLARELPGNAAFFGGYEFVCRELGGGRPKGEVSPWVQALAGAAGGCAYWTAFFPADVVKSVQQTTPGDRPFMQTMGDIYRQSGVRALYRGWGVTMVRAAPATAIIFVAYEHVNRVLQAKVLGS